VNIWGLYKKKKEYHYEIKRLEHLIKLYPYDRNKLESRIRIEKLKIEKINKQIQKRKGDIIEK
jgi:hypothetical protein